MKLSTYLVLELLTWLRTFSLSRVLLAPRAARADFCNFGNGRFQPGKAHRLDEMGGEPGLSALLHILAPGRSR